MLRILYPKNTYVEIQEIDKNPNSFILKPVNTFVFSKNKSKSETFINSFEVRSTEIPQSPTVSFQDILTNTNETLHRHTDVVFTNLIECNTSNHTPIIYKNPNYDGFVFILATTEFRKNVKNIWTTPYKTAEMKYTWLREINESIFSTNANISGREAVGDRENSGERSSKEFAKLTHMTCLFYETQKHYHAFAKLATIWKHNRYAVQVDYDLYMTPLSRNTKNVFTLLQQNKLYLFSAANLCHIITTALSHAPDFFVEPLVIKNPYNNVPFSKSTLYNIYFFIKKSTFIMPLLLHQYFIADFDLCSFLDKNENIIRDISIEKHVYNGSTDALYFSTISMLNEYNRKHPIVKIKIDTGFPKDKLVNHMRPYLELYMISRYSNEDSKGQIAEKMLHYKLHKLYKYNPCFGKKIVKLKNVKMFGRLMRKEITYCDHIPNFTDKYDRETYQTTHLEITDYVFDNAEDIQSNNATHNTDDDADDDESTIPDNEQSDYEEDMFEDEIPSPIATTTTNINATIGNIEVDDLIDSESDSDSKIQNVEEDSEEEIIIEGSDTDD
jgi:hypothetical protein